MIKAKKIILLSMAAVFVIFEGVMFYLVHIMEGGIPFRSYYYSIIAAAGFAIATLIVDISFAPSEGRRPIRVLVNPKDGNLLRIAMLFTLWADYYLVYAEVENQLAGVGVFLGTQLFIFLHIFVNDGARGFRMANIFVRLGAMLIAAATALIVLRDEVDLLSVISVIYYANLLSNAVFAHRTGKGGIILSCGLILFALCDINVGLVALNEMFGGFAEGSLVDTLVNGDVDLMWLFYIPSQTLIPLSLIFREEKNCDQ